MSFETVIAAIIIGLGLACVGIVIYLMKDSPKDDKEADIYRRMLK